MLSFGHCPRASLSHQGPAVKPHFAILLPLILVLMVIRAPDLAAGEATVTGGRVTTTAEQTRLVLDLSGPVTHQVFPLEGPDRVVLDLADAALTGKLPAATEGDLNLIGIRSGVRDGNDLRIVLDLKRPVRVKSAPLAPDADHGHRLVVDLIPKAASPSGGGRGGPTGSRSAASGKTPGPARGRGGGARDLVVAIDAGHGGADPGAIGARGTREKELTLSIARRLAALVAKEPGMRPLMIRDRDVFVSLRDRVLKARKHQADIFISIHADAFENPRAQGSSVFTLSRGGATSEAAKWLADKENSADLIGGVDLGASDDLLATVLLDMAQNATLEHSVQAADAVLKNLGRLGATHKAEVQKAGFVVLKSPDIPSLLVETAFVSNPDEEARLTNAAHQQRLAEAILGGIKRYFERYRPQTAGRAAVVDAPPTVESAPRATASASESAVYAAAAPAPGGAGGRQHVIGAGDTLALIAQRYGVSLTSLRTANNLNGDLIRAGQVLTIPSDG